MSEYTDTAERVTGEGLSAEQIERERARTDPPTAHRGHRALRVYCQNHHISAEDLEAVGARVAVDGRKAWLYTFLPRGIQSHALHERARTAIPGSRVNDFWLAADRGSTTAVVCEGIGDVARMAAHRPEVDVVGLAGARMVSDDVLAALARYEVVIAATDADTDGDAAAARIARLGAKVRRWRPEAKDWCELAEMPALPPVDELLAPERGLSTRGVDWQRVRRIDWLWEDRIPVGFLSLVIGNEGIGKGVTLAYLIARVTRGELPGTYEGTPGRVLIVGDEDGFDQVWVPRLVLAGADIDRVHTLADDETLANLTERESDLAATITREGYSWVIFDQLLDHIDGGRDGGGTHNAKHVRAGLLAPRRVARRCGVAVTGVLHPPKGKARTFRDLVSGSHQFNAVSRSSLLLAEDPDDPDRRVLVRGKGNHSAAPQAFEFKIAAREVAIPEADDYEAVMPYVCDTRETDRGIDEFVGAESRPGLTKLTEQVAEALTEAPQTLKAICEAVGRDPKNRQVREALKALKEIGDADKVDDKWMRCPSI